MADPRILIVADEDDIVESVAQQIQVVCPGANVTVCGLLSCGQAQLALLKYGGGYMMQ